MRRFWFAALVVAAFSTVLFAQDSSAFLSPLQNARFVYVTSYDGSQFSPEPLPADREAINTVQDALRNWGHYTIVFRPQDADMIVAVESRPSEDILAVYDPRSWRTGTYLWRATAKGGLTSPEMPLVHKFEAALGKITGRTAA